MAALLLLIAVLVWGPMRHVSTMLGAAAKVTTAVSSSVDGGIRAVSNASADIAAFAFSVAGSSLSSSQELWRGVDIVNVSIIANHKRVVGDEGADIVRWLSDASDADQLQPAEIDMLIDAAHKVGIRIPRVDAAKQSLVTEGVYRQFEATVALLETGHIGVQWSLFSVTFEQRWVNPLWQLLELEMSGESMQILDSLNRTLQKIPHAFPKFDDLLTTSSRSPIPGSLSTRLRRWLRNVFVAYRALWHGIMAWIEYVMS